MPNSHPDDRALSLSPGMERITHTEGPRLSDVVREAMGGVEVIAVPGTPGVAKQEMLWDIADEDHNLSIAQSIHTTDSLFLADVPVSCSDASTLQTFKVRDAMMPGKVLVTQGPHPQFVIHGGKPVRRAEVPPEERSKSSALMTTVVTLVLYQAGTVETFHYNVMRVLLEKKRREWMETGNTDPIVHITKTEIAEALKVSFNGQLSKTINDALRSLGGLRVTKVYTSPSSIPGFETVGAFEESMGPLVSNWGVEKQAGGSSPLGGRRSDVMWVEINGALVRAMTGNLRANERQWLLRSLNFDRHLKLRSEWQQQLHAMLDARLDTTGTLRMPLFELWTARLGRSESDFSTPAKARKVRFLLKRIMEEWQDTGYIDNFQIVTRTRVGGKNKGRPRKADIPQISGMMSVPIELNDDRAPVDVQVPVLDTKALEEWVYCEAGPQFYAGLRHKRPDFAKDILAATVQDAKQRQTLLEQHSAEFIIDTAYERLKVVLRDIGDRRDRLTVSQWLTMDYQVPSRVHQVRLVLAEFERRAEASRVGEPFKPLDPEFAERRVRLLVEATNRMIERDKLDIVKLAESPGLPSDEKHAELVECYRLAFSHFLEASGVSRAADELVRVTNPDVQRVYTMMADDAVKIAIRASAHMTWFKRLAAPISAAMPIVRKKDEIVEATVPRQMLIEAGRRFPKAMGLCTEMTLKNPQSWEAHIGRLLQRRIVEAHMEEQEFEKAEAKLAAVKGQTRGSGLASGQRE